MKLHHIEQKHKFYMTALPSEGLRARQAIWTAGKAFFFHQAHSVNGSRIMPNGQLFIVLFFSDR